MLTKQTKENLIRWNETPEENRDYAEGCMILLNASGDRIMYARLSANPKKNKDKIEYLLRKYIMFVLKDVTKQEVADMQRKVNDIARQDMSLITEKDEAPPRGKRQDHDSLPDDVKALYVENLAILRRMRELHMRLRNLSMYIRQHQVPCPDSERYPFLKEMIRLDKKYHDNWERYDRYIPESDVAEDKVTDPETDSDADASDTEDKEE